MGNTNSQDSHLIGMGCLLLGFLGVPIVVTGLYIFIAAIVGTATGYDATGLGGFLGPMIMLPGFLLSAILIPGVHLLKLDPKRLILPVVIITLFILLILGNGTAHQINITNKYRQELQKQEEWFKSQDVEILGRFKTKDVVTVRFSLEYDDRADSFDTITVNDFNKELSEKIIKPIGKDIINYRMDKSSLNYIVAITKTGYEKLKTSPNVKWIQLWEK